MTWICLPKVSRLCGKTAQTSSAHPFALAPLGQGLHSKCWCRCRKKGILRHRRWKCKLAHPLRLVLWATAAYSRGLPQCTLFLGLPCSNPIGEINLQHQSSTFGYLAFSTLLNRLTFLQHLFLAALSGIRWLQLHGFFLCGSF